MDADSWTSRLSSVSKHYQSTFQTRSGISDVYMGFEEIEADDDIREEFPCPFCCEYYDIIGLCCHIDDDHPVVDTNGACPVCAVRVGVDMVAHITLQHGNIFKVQRKRKSRKSGSHSTLSLLKKELRDGNLQSLFGGSSCIVSSSNSEPDPLLSSFILPMADNIVNSQSETSADTNSANKSKEQNMVERNVQLSPLSIKDQEKKVRQSAFIHGLLFSTMFEDTL